MSMSDHHKNVLISNRLRLVRDLILEEELFAVLQANRTLSSTMVQDIRSARTNQSQVGKLLDLLPKRGAIAFPTFIEALIESHQEPLAFLLDPSRRPLPEPSSTVIAQATDHRAGPKQPAQEKLSPSDTKSPSSSSSKPSHPVQPQEEVPSKGQVRSGVQEQVIDARLPNYLDAAVDDIIGSIKESFNKQESFIYASHACIGGDQPGKTDSLSSGYCAVVRNIYASHTSSYYNASFDDVNICEAFKPFAFDVADPQENQKASDIMKFLKEKADKEASAFLLLTFASRIGKDFLARDDKPVSIEEIIEIFNTSAALKGRPKVLIFQLTDSVDPKGDSTDSVPVPGSCSFPSKEFSELSLKELDNMAILTTVPSRDGLEVHWLVWSLVILLVKYSKTYDLSTMLRIVERVLQSKNYAVTLRNHLKEGLYFSS